MARTPKTTSRFDRDVENAVATAQGQRHKPAQRKDGKMGRFYEVEDGKSYPSVTNILGCIGKPALIRWSYNQAILHATDTHVRCALNMQKMVEAGGDPFTEINMRRQFNSELGTVKADQKVLEKAGEIGTQVHKLIEWNLRRQLNQLVGPEPHVVSQAQWAFMAYQDWATKHHLKPIYIEQTVYSDEYEFAGTMDLIAEVDGVVSLVDFKTGKSIYGEAYLQNVAYQVAFIEMGHVPKPEQGIIVRLPKNESDPEFETAICPPRQSLFPVFLSVIEVWKWWFAAEKAYRESRSTKKKAGG